MLLLFLVVPSPWLSYIHKSSCNARVGSGFFSFLKCDTSAGAYRVAQKREDAVSKEVTRKLSEADNRKMSRKEKDERWCLSCPSALAVGLALMSVRLWLGLCLALLFLYSTHRVGWDLSALTAQTIPGFCDIHLNISEILSPLAPRILWKKNEVADYEATTFSIFYNNTLFLVLVIIASFFVLKNFNPTVYPLPTLNPTAPLLWVVTTTCSCCHSSVGKCSSL